MAPFMGEKKLPSFGLNPLGIRTASEQLFTTLLPGLNVVTLRVRYYSFYCWLLKNFYEPRTDAHLYDFKKHIRTSELLMALIHANSNTPKGIPGITRANEIINRNGENIFFLDDAMPDGKATGGYWKGTNGALGTYYAASMQEIGLILPLTKNNKFYNVTPYTDSYISGEQLADAFENTIGKDLSSSFRECAQTCAVTKSQLVEMETKFQTHIMPNNEERRILLNMLLQKDTPRSDTESYMRRDTLCFLLNYIQDNDYQPFTELGFAKYMYESYKKNRFSNITALGWYDYYLNDNRQFEALNLFDEVLERLINSQRPGKWEEIEDFSNKLAYETCSDFGNPHEKLSSLFSRWETISTANLTNTISKAFYRFFDDYVRNEGYEKCKEEIKRKFWSVRNDAIDFFDSIKKCLDYTLVDYIKQFLKQNIIYGHYGEAMRKYAQNGVPTHKLLIEDGYVKGLERYGSSHSSPRVETLYTFATDLGIIDNNQLTNDGKELLKMIAI